MHIPHGISGFCISFYYIEFEEFGNIFTYLLTFWGMEGKIIFVVIQGWKGA
jgi:hypothetical protein